MENQSFLFSEHAGRLTLTDIVPERDKTFPVFFVTLFSTVFQITFSNFF